MSVYDTAAWQNFYVMVGGAAAALTGLLFVAMSLHSKAIIAQPLHGTRAVGTPLSLMTQLFVAGTVLIPQPAVALGVEVEVAALVSVVQTVRGVMITLGTAERRVRSRMRTTLEGIGAAMWILLFVASGISLIAQAVGGLYLLAAVMPFMFGWNVYAWVLITGSPIERAGRVKRPMARCSLKLAQRPWKRAGPPLFCAQWLATPVR